MHYVMDIHENYVKKPGRNPKQPKLGMHDEPNRQPNEMLAALETLAQGPLAPPLLALLDTQSVILDELIHLRQIMMSDLIRWTGGLLTSSPLQMPSELVEDLRAAQPPPPAFLIVDVPL